MLGSCGFWEVGREAFGLQGRVREAVLSRFKKHPGPFKVSGFLEIEAVGAVLNGKAFKGENLNGSFGG